jgi:hypothetical protein
MFRLGRGAVYELSPDRREDCVSALASRYRDFTTLQPLEVSLHILKRTTARRAGSKGDR